MTRRGLFAISTLFTTFAVFAVMFAVLPASVNGSRAAYPADGSRPVAEQREEAVNRLAGLNEQERALVAELLDWDVRIEAARLDYERLNREIPAVRQALADAEAGLSATRQQLSEERDRLGWWVNFLYRYGAVAYLEVLLGAADFNDFVARAEMVKSVIAAQVRTMNGVRELMLRQDEQVAMTEQAQADLAAKTGALAQRIAEMEQSRAGREAFLAELKRQSADLAGQVVRYETALYQSINPLRYLWSRLDKLPWYDLSPDKIYLSGGGLQIELTDEEINRVLSGQGDPGLASLSVRSSSGLFSISGQAGPADGGVDFTLEGNFVPEAAGKVRFQPSRLLLAGLPVSGEVLDCLAAEKGLSVDLGARAQGYRITEIRAVEGRLVIIGRKEA